MSALRRPDSLLTWAAQTLGHEFARPELCYAALTHRSAGGEHNERLEFLGDSVLNCSVARLLFDAHPDADEGALSRLRATLVSGDSLALVAAELGVGAHLRLGAGELKTGGFRRSSILADALEALLGAVYLDAGFDTAAGVVTRIMMRKMLELPAADDLKDPKTRLQEAMQAQSLGLPQYSLLQAVGEAHAQTFSVQCALPTLGIVAVAEGGSRRRAEQSAAAKVLSELPLELKPRA